MDVELRATRAGDAAAAVCRKRHRVRVLRVEPSGRLAVAVERGGLRRVLQVRAFQTPRLSRFYVELDLRLEDGRRISTPIFPGVCDRDAFRRLRKFLLRVQTPPDKAGFINRLAEQSKIGFRRLAARLIRRADALE